MKTIEEKAKAYDEALERAKTLYENANGMILKKWVEQVFPELRETDDEKIRKELIKHLKEGAEGYEPAGDSSDYQRWLAWLEKQSEKPADKVEPKFKVGDWIINPRTGLIKHIKNVLLCDNNGNYEFESSSMSIDSVDNSFHLWTIQDAKDGDVLVTRKKQPFIFKNYDEDTDYVYAYCGICDLVKDNSFYADDDQLWTCYSVAGDVYPATKEQRDLLFQKMKEAGYTFNFEKKELKMITQKPEENKGNIGEISPNWSEEDKGIIEEVVSYLINYSNIVESKEDADRIEYLIDKIQDICPHQKQEWSEEDEQHIDSLLKRLDALCRNKFERTRFAISEDRDWLKSLRPQNQWKPSDEQMMALWNHCSNGSVLTSLYNDLKKLKEGNV